MESVYRTTSLSVSISKLRFLQVLITKIAENRSLTYKKVAIFAVLYTINLQKARRSDMKFPSVTPFKIAIAVLSYIRNTLRKSRRVEKAKPTIFTPIYSLYTPYTLPIHPYIYPLFTHTYPYISPIYPYSPYRHLIGIGGLW